MDHRTKRLHRPHAFGMQIAKRQFVDKDDNVVFSHEDIHPALARKNGLTPILIPALFVPYTKIMVCKPVKLSQDISPTGFISAAWKLSIFGEIPSEIAIASTIMECMPRIEDFLQANNVELSSYKGYAKSAGARWSYIHAEAGDPCHNNVPVTTPDFDSYSDAICNKSIRKSLVAIQGGCEASQRYWQNGVDNESLDIKNSNKVFLNLTDASSIISAKMKPGCNALINQKEKSGPYRVVKPIQRSIDYSVNDLSP
jgi:hypothetical protein